MTVRDVFAGLEQDDPSAIVTVSEIGRILAPAVAAISAILDPRIIILGGSIGMREELVAEIRKALVRCSSHPPHVEASVLGSRATLEGGLGVAVKHIFENRSLYLRAAAGRPAGR